MSRPVLVLVVVLFVGLGCQSSADQSNGSSSQAAAVIDSAIAAHGGSVLDRATVSFDFRGDQFRLHRDGGRFHYRRRTTDSLGRTIEEGLTNDSLYRIVDGTPVSLSADEQAALDTRVNSVAYLALLPYPLQDPAVQPHYEGQDTIKGTPYHRVKVTFQPEGGGRDWQDVFMYWFHTETYAMDYLAYAFGLGPGEEPGTRFREAYNVRRIHGVRVADYYNYTVDTLSPDALHRYPDLLGSEALDLVSRVELDSVEVTPFPADS